MQRIGPYKYMVDMQNEADLDAINSYFLIEFESDGKLYIGWTGETGSTIRQVLYRLIYYAFKKGSNWLSRNNPGIYKAFNDSKYITVSVLKKAENGFSGGISAIYEELYALIDEYSCYAPYGHNVINQLNKCPAEKDVIHKFALKWNIPDTIKRNGTRENYSSRAVYEYRKISDDTFVFYKQWNSVKEYADSVKPFKISPSAIYMCCNGQRRVAYGSTWRFDNKENTLQVFDMRKHRGSVGSIKRNLEENISDRISKYKAQQLKTEEK